MLRFVYTISIALLLFCNNAALAVAPGGVYAHSDAVQLSLNPELLPRTLGFHMVHGTTIYHGRKIPFSAGIFLPPAFIHAKGPMPILVALHNRAQIGAGAGGLSGEGMGRVLAHGGSPDGRSAGDRPDNPIDLRQEAQFIGLVPQCPSGFAWEEPQMADMVCKFIAQMVTAYHADDDRVYLTGFSYGASSTWRIALMAPTRFAAIICCDGRATPDPIHDVAKLQNVAIYVEVGQWDGPFVEETDRMHRALDTLPHRNFIFRMIPGGNHFCYQTVYDDPEVWKWVYAQKRHS